MSPINEQRTWRGTTPGPDCIFLKDPVACRSIDTCALGRVWADFARGCFTTTSIAPDVLVHQPVSSGEIWYRFAEMKNATPIP